MPSHPIRRIPGEAGIWVLLLGELLMFSAFFLVIVYTRNQDVALFLRSQAALNQTIGLVNTLLLLTSSLAVAYGWHHVHAGKPRADRLFLAALALGVGFVVLKAIEYGEKIAAGISLLTNDFYLFYFVFTGIHLMHVLAGIGFLAFMTHAARGRLASEHPLWIECGALFWHLVDLLWILLFALFYLLK